DRFSRTVDRQQLHALTRSVEPGRSHPSRQVHLDDAVEQDALATLRQLRWVGVVRVQVADPCGAIADCKDIAHLRERCDSGAGQVDPPDAVRVAGSGEDAEVGIPAVEVLDLYAGRGIGRGVHGN